MSYSQDNETWAKLANHVLVAAYSNGSPESRCLPGTRTQLLSDITNHLDKQSRNVIWLHGAVGTGKTAVALSIVDKLKKDDRLAGCFFFSRKDTRRQSLSSVLPTIAYQLGVGHPRAREAVVRALEKDPSLLNKECSYLEQLVPLFVEPLQELRFAWNESLDRSHDEGSIVRALTRAFVFDGIDEVCNPREYVTAAHFFRSLFGTLRRNNMPYVHIFLTSRTDFPLQRALGVLGQASSRVIDIHSYDAEPDIFHFMKSHLAELALQSSDFPITTWPSEQDIIMITKRAEGQFIFAVTVARFITGPDAHYRLTSILRHDSSTGGSNIFDLYRLILDEYEGQTGQQHPCPHLAIICCLSQPVFPQQLRQLMAMGDFLEQLKDFPSLVVVSRSPDIPIEARHNTLREFFTNNAYSRAHHIEEQVSHGMIAYRCFVLMNFELNRSVFGLEDPNAPARFNAQVHCFKEARDSKLSPSSALYYACMYWVDHLCLSKGSATLGSLDQQVHAFVHTKLLYWIEVMAALNKLGLGLHMLRKASMVIEDCPWDTPTRMKNLQLLHDAERLVQEFSPSLRLSVMSLYHSALPFLPRDSGLRQTFNLDGEQSRVRVLRGLVPQWSPRTHSIDVVANLPSRQPSARGSNPLNLVGVAVSPDATHVASWHRDGSLHLWDALTGSKIGSLPFVVPFSSTCRHKRSIHFENAITFSADGTYILMVSREGVRLWEVGGRPDESFVLPTLNGMNGSYWLCCAMSANSEKGFVIVAGATSSISTWYRPPDQLEPWKEFASCRVPDGSCCTSVSIAPCGEWILSSACGDIAVCLRDAKTLAAVRELSLGHSAPPPSLLVCHFFRDDDHVIVLWSAQPNIWLLTASKMSSSQTFSGKLVESSRLEPLPSAWNIFKSKPKPMQLPFGLKSATLLSFGGRITSVQIMDQLFTLNGLRFTAFSPRKPLARGSYGRIGTISDDKRSINLWDPSIPPSRGSVSTHEVDVAHHLDVLGVHGDRFVTAMISAGGERVADVTIFNASYASSDGERPFSTEVFTSVAASYGFQSFFCLSLSQSITLRSQRHKFHHALEPPRMLTSSEAGCTRSFSFSPSGDTIVGLYSRCVVVWCLRGSKFEQFGVVRGCFNAVVFSHDSTGICCLRDRKVLVHRIHPSNHPARTGSLSPAIEGSNFVCATFSSNDANIVYTVEAVYHGSTLSNKFTLLAYRHYADSSRPSAELKSKEVYCLSVTEAPNYFIPTGNVGTSIAANEPPSQVYPRIRAKGDFTFSPGRSLLALHSSDHYYETIRLFDSNEVDPFGEIPSGSTVDVQSWSDFSLRNSGWIYKGTQTLCWVPPAYRPYSLDARNMGLGKCSGFKVLGGNKVLLVQQHDFVVLHFPRVV